MWPKPNKDQSRHDGSNLQFDRRTEAKLRRKKAAALAAKRPHATHQSNGEEILAGQPSNFRKGLEHGEDGFLVDCRDYQAYRSAIRSGLPDEVDNVPTPPPPAGMERRKWESPGTGFVFDLEGPDAQAITMPPAPKLDSAELAAELAEVYVMAKLRDTRFSDFRADGTVSECITTLNKFSWFGTAFTKRESCNFDVNQIFGKAAGRFLGRERASVTPGNLFRGVTEGDDNGPFISQFLLVGNPSRGADAKGAIKIQEWGEEAGKIAYGAHTIDQRIRFALENRDFMTTFGEWKTVQNGVNVNLDYLFDYNDSGYSQISGIGDPNEPNGPAYRFISTPRDLATYVHFDQLYQAYLNACIVMLERKVPTDPGFKRFNNGFNQQGFAQFGGPHILSLVTEVATRALKAVRFQKFNIHNRTRPEALGGLMEKLRDGCGDERLQPLRKLWISLQENSVLPMGNHLLPMAFPEGSPMHPSYGAGHATVAGACVTVLKAFFDHQYYFVEPGRKDKKGDPFQDQAYEANPSTGGRSLCPVHLSKPLTVEGELNKLASNISIGRNMAGVHYFSDYIESLRLGELIALGILEEQALMYNSHQFPFSMTVPLYDGGTVVIGTLE
ncbi:MAG: vanadium-dependent haloperoxidase [Cyanobacteria bacterium P01_A01_bin.17]